MTTAMSVRELSKSWQFKQTDTEEWMTVAHVPTNVHLDLMNNNKYAVVNASQDKGSTNRFPGSWTHFLVSTSSNANGLARSPGAIESPYLKYLRKRTASNMCLPSMGWTRLPMSN